MIYLMGVIILITVIVFVIMISNLEDKKNKINKRNLVDQIIYDLEIKKTIDIVNEYASDEDKFEYEDEDKFYYYFKKYKKEFDDSYTPGFRGHYDNVVEKELLLSKDFTIIKILNERGNPIKIIDLSLYREKIEEEFKDLIQGLALQRQSYLKLNKYMKDTAIELVETQKKYHTLKN